MARNRNNRKKVKRPRSYGPTSSKIPRKDQSLEKKDIGVKFSTEIMDYGGTWGWQNFNNRELRELIPKIIDFSGLNFSELGHQRSHFVNLNDLVKEAQERLREIKEEDIEKLFSLRLDGKKRIWCIAEGNVLQILWWDSKHEVCPSHKKHT